MTRIELTAADRAAVSALLDWRARTGGTVELTLSASVYLKLTWGRSLRGDWIQMTGPTLADAVHTALEMYEEETR